ncbi:MAG TPA: efflux RND transporter periplasmic adaptor subunit [Gammaproteobacteria bacterium]|nr:efflux RND transporter periplasmic adaptor subunit [Gammaproteobacteria bacterium]
MNKQTVFGVLIALVLGGGGGYWVASYLGSHGGAPGVDAEMAGAGPEVLFYRNPMNPAITSPVPAQDEMGMDYIPVYAGKDEPKKAPEVLFYRNPMNPAITSPVPAQDEMGMDYIPVYAEVDADSKGDPTGTVRIDPVTVQNIGVRVAVAERQALSRDIRAVGRVDFDEERLSRLHPKTEGWIEELYIDKTGEQIGKDAILLSIYSPQLVTSQQEYLLALNSLDALKESPYEEIRLGAEQLVTSSRERLELLDVPEHQIRELERTRRIKKNLHIHSPFDGVIMNIGAREGQFVTPTTELYKIADLSRVWVFADVYETEVSWIQAGDPVDMKLAAIPGKVFTGRVGYVYPYAEAKTRTIKVRLEFDNPDLLLKPDMFADVTIHAQRTVDALVIPAEAVVRSGEREQVFVVRAPGKFEPRVVRLGVSSRGMVQVIEGVAAGEVVVTSSQFLIDSESKLREATAKMLETMSAGQGGR